MTNSWAGAGIRVATARLPGTPEQFGALFKAWADSRAVRPA